MFSMTIKKFIFVMFQKYDPLFAVTKKKKKCILRNTAIVVFLNVFFFLNSCITFYINSQLKLKRACMRRYNLLYSRATAYEIQLFILERNEFYDYKQIYCYDVSKT